MTKLTKRAESVLRDIGANTVEELRKIVDLDPFVNGSLMRFLLQTPNCGRKTATEIVEWAQSEGEKMPIKVWVRLDKTDSGRWKIISASISEVKGDGWHTCTFDPPHHS